MVVDIVYDDEMSWLLVFAVRRGVAEPTSVPDSGRHVDRYMYMMYSG